MAKKSTREPAANGHRGPGKPKRGTSPVTHEVLELIAIRWLQGISQCQIAREFGITEAAVRYHVDRTIKPLWQERMRSYLDEELAKVALIERIAWERFDASTQPEKRRQVKKALLEGGSEPQIVERVVTKISKTGEIAWIQAVQWCLEFRARIHGHFAPVRGRVDHGSELRVAGKTPGEVGQEMVERLIEKAKERLKYEQGLDQGRNEA